MGGVTLSTLKDMSYMGPRPKTWLPAHRCNQPPLAERDITKGLNWDTLREETEPATGQPCTCASRAPHTLAPPKHSKLS